jgi:hypothetical protein
MKNADRINFYAAGLRPPPPAGSAVRAGSSPAAVSPAAATALPAPAPGASIAIGAQPSSVLDQAKLHHLLQRLDGAKQRHGESQDLPATVRRRHRRLAIGLTLAIAIIAVQASAVVWLYQRAEMLLGRPLSPALLLTAAADDLDVIFRPSASNGDISVLLRELDLRVVDGPNEAGRYVIRPDQTADRDHALNALRDRRDLVYSAAATD